jgi:hypothetical protein
MRASFSPQGILMLPRDRVQNLKEEEISSPNFGGGKVWALKGG